MATEMEYPVIALVKPQGEPPRKPQHAKSARVVAVKEDLPRLVESWMRELQATNHSPYTLRTYGAGMHQFIAWLREQELPLLSLSIQHEHCLSYMAWMHEEGLAAASVLARYTAVRLFFAWLVELGEMDGSPMARVKRPKLDKGTRPTPVLGDEAIARVLRMCRGRDFLARRDEAIIRTLLDTGVRRGELVSMQVPPSLDLGAQTVEVTGKTGTRVVPFGLNTARALDRYLLARERHDYASAPQLWLGKLGPLTVAGAYQIVERRARAAGLDAYTHLLRHTWAHTYKAAGGSMEDLAELGGWSDMASVRRYGKSAAHARAMEDYKRRGLGDRV